ncbi:MAG: pyridoxal-phosphate dependent enzyme [Candidatus Thorarchaeota archaeon]
MSFQGIEDAYKRVKGIVNNTPVMTSRTLNRITGADVYFKCENFQRVGAFKFRGAYNALSQLSDDEKKRGTITHSSGNHAQAVALAASLLRIHSTIVMPKGAPKNKINATKGYGAEIVFCDNTLEARSKTAEKIKAEKNLILIHPFDNDVIINGQGTAAYELIKEIGELDIVIAPLGGGGLLSGTAIAVKSLCPNAQVFGVEPSIADDAYRSIQAGYIIPSTYPDTIADGLRTSICERTFKIIQKFVDGILTVSEMEIIEAMKFLWERMKIVVEPSGAVPLAALLSKKIEVTNKKVGLIISGGNIDIEPFLNLLKKKINDFKEN